MLVPIFSAVAVLLASRGEISSSLVPPAPKTPYPRKKKTKLAKENLLDAPKIPTSRNLPGVKLVVALEDEFLQPGSCQQRITHRGILFSKDVESSRNLGSRFLLLHVATQKV